MKNVEVQQLTHISIFRVSGIGLCVHACIQIIIQKCLGSPLMRFEMVLGLALGDLGTFLSLVATVFFPPMQFLSCLDCCSLQD